MDSFEKNDILGAHPSATEVDAYFVGYMLVAAALWKLTPRELRWATSTMIIGLQTSTILENHAVARQLEDGSMCGDTVTD